MAYQKTFSFNAASCPKKNSEFWKDIEISMQALWGDASTEEVDYISASTKEKRKAVRVVITAKTISHLCNCSFELADLIAEFKIAHRNFLFHEATVPGSFEQDEEQNKNYRRVSK